VKAADPGAATEVQEDCSLAGLVVSTSQTRLANGWEAEKVTVADVDDDGHAETPETVALEHATQLPPTSTPLVQPLGHATLPTLPQTAHVFVESQ
jgi:hypothetical protein